MHHAAESVDRQPSKHRRQIVSERRMANLIVDEGELRVSVGQAHDRLHHVVPISPAYPRGAHDGRRYAERQCLAFTHQLGNAVDAFRTRLVPLVVRPVECTVEDVIRADLNQVSANTVGCLG